MDESWTQTGAPEAATAQTERTGTAPAGAAALKELVRLLARQAAAEFLQGKSQMD
jgi:hypothetical protein